MDHAIRLQRLQQAVERSRIEQVVSRRRSEQSPAVDCAISSAMPAMILPTKPVAPVTRSSFHGVVYPFAIGYL
jgi:hypothetical protein